MVVEVWKYDIILASEWVVPMPIGAEILTVQIQHGKPKMWVLVNTKLGIEYPLEDRRFIVIDTGQAIPDDHPPIKYIGTFQLYDGDYVGHIFEVL